MTRNITGCYPWLQLTDGSVMLYGYRFALDINGSYVNMSLSRYDPLPSGYQPIDFASAVLPDGRVIYEGGECSNSSNCTDFTNLGAIYDPVANTSPRYRRRAGGRRLAVRRASCWPTAPS